MKNIIVFLKYCNNDCIFCYCDYDKCSDLFMDFYKFRKLIDSKMDEAIIAGERLFVFFTGGECTIHPDFMKMVDYLYEKKLLFEISTNARKLAEMDFIKLLQQKGLQTVYTSVHGKDDEKHDMITNKWGSFKEAMPGIRNYIFLNIPVTTNTVLCSLNYGQALDIAVMLEGLGVKSIRYSFIKYYEFIPQFP